MALIPYTTSEEVRAVLGVSKTELPDATLLLPIYEAGMLEDLAKIDPLLKATLDNLMTAVPAPTAVNEVRFVRVAKLFMAYSVAMQLLNSLPMFSVKSLTDGKAEFSRQSEVIDTMTANITKMWGSLRNTLQVLYGTLVVFTPVAATLPTLSAGVTLTDPVTSTG